MNGFSEDYPTPPSANPAKYCHFCYSRFRIEPLFTESLSENEALLSRIESLVQVQLDPERDRSCAICFLCRQKLTEFEMFRDRCRKLHEAARRCWPFPTLELPDSGEVDCYSQADYSSLSVSINPLSFLKDFEDVREEDSFVVEERTSLNETCKQFNASELTVVDPKDLKKNNSFWQVLSHDVEAIPNHIRRILELTGRCRQESLAFISPSTIKRIEESMRNAVQMLINHEKRHANADRKKALIKYYGKGHWNHPERFCFNEEEKTTILSIASAVQQKGVRHYLKKAKVTANEVLEKVENPREHAEMLIDTIRKYYQERDSKSDQSQSFFKQLPDLEHIQIYRRPNGTLQATVQCPICQKISKAHLTNDGNCYRQIYNFVRHHCRTEGLKLGCSAAGGIRHSKRNASVVTKFEAERLEKERQQRRPGLRRMSEKEKVSGS